MLEYLSSAWTFTASFLTVPNKRTADMVLTVWLLLLLTASLQVFAGVFLFNLSLQRLSVLGHFMTVRTLLQQCQEQSQKCKIQLPYFQSSLTPCTLESFFYALALLLSSPLFFHPAFGTHAYVLPLMLPLFITGCVGLCLQLAFSDDLAHQCFADCNWRQGYRVQKETQNGIQECEYLASSNHHYLDGKRIASRARGQHDLEASLKKEGRLLQPWHSPKRLCQTLAAAICLLGLWVVMDALSPISAYVILPSVLKQAIFSMFPGGISPHASTLLLSITSFLQPICLLSGSYHLLQFVVGLAYRKFRRDFSSSHTSIETPIGRIRRQNNQLLVRTLVAQQHSDRDIAPLHWQCQFEGVTLDADQPTLFFPMHASLWQQYLASILSFETNHASVTVSRPAYDFLRTVPGAFPLQIPALQYLWMHWLVPFFCPWMTFFLENTHERRHGVWISPDMHLEDIQQLCHDFYASDTRPLTIIAATIIAFVLYPVLPLWKTVLVYSYCALLPFVINAVSTLLSALWRSVFVPVFNFTVSVPGHIISLLRVIGHTCYDFFRRLRQYHFSAIFNPKTNSSHLASIFQLPTDLVPCAMAQKANTSSQPFHVLATWAHHLSFVIHSAVSPKKTLGETKNDPQQWLQQQRLFLYQYDFISLRKQFDFNNMKSLPLFSYPSFYSLLHGYARHLVDDLIDANSAYLTACQQLSGHLASSPAPGYAGVAVTSYQKWLNRLFKRQANVQQAHVRATVCIGRIDDLIAGKSAFEKDLLSCEITTMDALWSICHKMASQYFGYSHFTNALGKKPCAELKQKLEHITFSWWNLALSDAFPTPRHRLKLAKIRAHATELLDHTCDHDTRALALTNLQESCRDMAIFLSAYQANTFTTLDMILSKPKSLSALVQRYRLLLKDEHSVWQTIGSIKPLLHIYNKVTTTDLTCDIKSKEKTPINPFILNLIEDYQRYLNAINDQKKIADHYQQEKDKYPQERFYTLAEDFKKAQADVRSNWDNSKKQLCNVMQAISVAADQQFSALPEMHDTLSSEPALLIPQTTA